MKKAYTLCDWCGEIYDKRPFLCSCNSNVFLHEVMATKEEVDKSRSLTRTRNSLIDYER